MSLPSRRVLIRAFGYVTTLGRPGPDLSWINPWLAISAALQPRHIQEAAQMGVRAIVDLREEGKDDEGLLTRHGIRFLHLPTPNYWPLSLAQLVQGTDWVLSQLAAGQKTLVHCQEGVGRSVVLACCVLMRQGHDLLGALGLVRARRWGVALNARQMAGLEEFARFLGVHRPTPFGILLPEQPRRRTL